MVRIGLTAGFEQMNRLPSSYINHDYVNALITKGAVPILIPAIDDFGIIDQYLEHVDGIMLTGGEDVDPELYNEKNSGLSLDVCRARDRAEMYIIEKSLKMGYPILGICRGFQILNVFFGGTLYQDIPSQFGKAVEHVNPMAEREALHHDVIIRHDSRIGRLFGSERVKVNSRHHQGIRRLGDGLLESAAADDGIIEAFEDPGRGIVAVQWHPENITRVSEGCSRLFGDLVDRARGN